MLPQVFELFAQAERTLDRAQGGLGIGLTLVRSLVELHGGTVEAHSDGPGKGSEFVVRLPLPQRRRRSRRASRARRRRASPAQRILVVDDNRDAADSLGVLLALRGAEVRDGPRRRGGARGVRTLPARGRRCSTSACRRWTATRWRAACAQRRTARSCC